jgi:hypothetical protein
MKKLISFLFAICLFGYAEASVRSKLFEKKDSLIKELTDAQIDNAVICFRIPDKLYPQIFKRVRLVRDGRWSLLKSPLTEEDSALMRTMKY